MLIFCYGSRVFHAIRSEIPMLASRYKVRLNFLILLQQSSMTIFSDFTYHKISTCGRWDPYITSSLRPTGWTRHYAVVR